VAAEVAEAAEVASGAGAAEVKAEVAGGAGAAVGALWLPSVVI
jgi:hypothetical protein